MRVLWPLSAAAVLLAACSQPGKTEKGAGQPGASRRVVATIEGVFDGSRLTLRQASPAPASPAAALVEIPVVQDGEPNSNPPDTLELVTESAGIVADGCGPGVDSFDGTVTLRSFYPHRHMWNTYVEILAITPAGHEACNSASPAPAGTKNQSGLFPYGSVDRYGTAGNASTALWRFRLSDRTPFAFTGRVVAEVFDDAAPPTTIPSMPPGTFRWAFPLNLDCSDGMYGSGCREIHYTTDGSTPTLASPVIAGQSGTLDIFQTTTVKLFAVDWFGNEEPVQTLRYVIDQTPPTVFATSPAGYGVLPDGGGPIVVAFSEPVDPASVAIQLRDSWTTYGPFVPDAGGTTFTFTPYSALAPGTLLTLDVTTALDLVGNGMYPPFTTRFAVGDVPPLEVATGPATIMNQALVSSFNAGTVALYSEWTGSGGRLFAARRPTGQGWHAPVLLDAAPTSAPISARAHDTAFGLLVAWSTDTATRAALFSGASDAPDWIVDVFPTATAFGNLDVTQTPGGLAVVRAAGQKLQVVYGIDRGEWGAPRELDFELDGSKAFRWPRIAWSPPPGEGLSPRMQIFYAASGGFTLKVIGEDPLSFGGWGGATYVPGTDFTSPLTVPPVAFDSPGGVEVVWAPPTGGIRSAEHLPGNPVPTWVERVLQAGSEFVYPPSAATELVGTGSGDSRAVGWFSPLDHGEPWGSFFQNGAWSPAERIAGLPASQLALGGNFYAAMISNLDPFRVDATLLDPVPPSTLSTVSWNSGTPTWALDPFPSQARSPRVNDVGLVTWARQRDPDSDALWSGAPNGFPPEVVGSTSRRAEALDVSAAARGAWEGAAVWIEQRTSGPAPVMTRVGYGNSWREPLLEDRLYSGGRAFAAGSSMFFAYASGRAPMDGNWTLSVTPIGEYPGNNALAAPIIGAPEIAIAAHPALAVVAFSDGMVIGAAAYENGAWSFPSTLGTGTRNLGPIYPSAAAGGSSVLVGWRNELGQPQVADPRWVIPPATFLGSLGMNGPVVAVGDRDSSYFPRAGAAWLEGTRVVAVALQSSAVWGTPAAITAAGASCGEPQLASDGPTFVAVFPCDGVLLASRFDGTAWSTPFTVVAPAPLAWSLAGSPAGYRVALVRDDGGVAHAYQVRIAGTSAGAPERLDQGAGTVRPAIRLTADLGFFCAAWSQVVDDPYAAQPRARCFIP